MSLFYLTSIFSTVILLKPKKALKVGAKKLIERKFCRGTSQVEYFGEELRIQFRLQWKKNNGIGFRVEQPDRDSKSRKYLTPLYQSVGKNDFFLSEGDRIRSFSTQICSTVMW